MTRPLRTSKQFHAWTLPQNLDNQDDMAYRMVVTALNEIIGPQDQAWHSFRNAENKTYVKTGPNPNPK